MFSVDTIVLGWRTQSGYNIPGVLVRLTLCHSSKVGVLTALSKSQKIRI